MNYEILVGDCRDRLKDIPDASIQCCITSPPFLNLRDYGMEGQLGIEGLYDYVESLRLVFEEVRRILRSDGTLWLNLGDSFAGNCSAGNKVFGNPEFNKNRPSRAATKTSAKRIPEGLKTKDLIGFPWRVAFALQASGWYLRSDIIWEKPNCMPASVKDRPTTSHEYLFLLAKSEKYFYNADAIREPCSDVSLARVKRTHHTSGHKYEEGPGGQTLHNDLTNACHPKGRNKRTIWTVSSTPFKGAHFAVYPEKLIEPCVLASTRSGDRILDPFSGAGTTGLVALKHGRLFTGIELNPAYIEMSVKRIEESLNIVTKPER